MSHILVFSQRSDIYCQGDVELLKKCVEAELHNGPWWRVDISNELMEVVNSLLIFHAAERSPRPLTRTQMVRTELAKTRPRAGKADITRQVEMIASMDFQEGPLNADTLTLATGVPPVSQTVYVMDKINTEC